MTQETPSATAILAEETGELAQAAAGRGVRWVLVGADS